MNSNNIGIFRETLQRVENQLVARVQRNSLKKGYAHLVSLNEKVKAIRHTQKKENLPDILKSVNQKAYLDSNRAKRVEIIKVPLDRFAHAETIELNAIVANADRQKYLQEKKAARVEIISSPLALPTTGVAAKRESHRGEAMDLSEIVAKANTQKYLQEKKAARVEIISSPLALITKLKSSNS